MSDIQKVLAITVAYNVPDALQRCLQSLDAQTRPVDGVLIVDNSQPCPVALDLDGLPIEERTRVVPSGANLGPAGGFALGLERFLRESVWTHAWLMDDDTYPEAEALESLLDVSASTRPGQLVFPSATNLATGNASAYPGWGHAPLLDRRAVEVGGLPRADLFWWIEDTEYLQRRLPRAGVTVVRAERARVTFDQPRREGAKPPWKYYYEVRNSVWYRLRLQRSGLGGKRKLFRVLARLLVSASTRGKRRENLMMFCHGLADGVRGRLGVLVEPPTVSLP